MANKKIVNEIKITPKVKDKPEIGIDLTNSIQNDIINATQFASLDVSSIDALSQSAQNREQVYELIDSMTQDATISAVLKQYAADIVQTNDKGQTVWIESENADVLNYTNWLVDSLNIDKHIYQWAYCLVTYGDVYARLFRQSDVVDDNLFSQKNNLDKFNTKEPLNEDIKLRVYGNNDHYIPYVQMVDNPGELFDLQRFGKCYGYIKAPVRIVQQTSDEMYNYLTHYKMKRNDIEIFDSLSFVHGCLEHTNQRQPETVEIFTETAQLQDENEFNVKDSMTSSYAVKRGQSILYNAFRSWRELNLLEMSALLNRLTKSSVVRVLNVEVGDMPKEQVQNFMQRLKDKIEQKSAIDPGNGMKEYTNPGPIENTIYVPTHGGQGQINATAIGGDFDPKSLVDLEYFRKILFGALGVPKEFFGFTDDGGGFNAGSSLTIISAQYGKTIKQMQNIMCQFITDIINLFLIDRGLDNYINRFTVRMQSPVTQEELDRRANTDNRIRYIGDVMNQLTDVEDKVTRLKIYKSLLSSSLNDSEVISSLQDYIEKLENEEKQKGKKSDDNSSNESEEENNEMMPSLENFEDKEEEEKEIIQEEGIEEEKEDDSYLPSPEDLNIDMTDKE